MGYAERPIIFSGSRLRMERRPMGVGGGVPNGVKLQRAGSTLANAIYYDSGAWERNDWVWIVEFRVHEL